MGKYEVTWDEYDQFAFSLDLKKKKRDGVDPAGQPESEKKADAVTRPTPPYADETFGFGRKGQPVICITHHAAMEYCRWLSAKTGKTLPPAHRGRVGICLPRGDQIAVFLRRRSGSARRLRLVRRERREAAADRQEEAESLGPLRHPRQRGGMVPRPLRARAYKQFRRATSQRSARSCCPTPRSIPTWPAAARGTTTPTGSAAPRGRRRTPSGASRTPSGPRASGGTPTPPSLASGSSGPLSEQENLKGLKSLVVKGKTTR